MRILFGFQSEADHWPGGGLQEISAGNIQQNAGDKLVPLSCDGPQLGGTYAWLVRPDPGVLPGLRSRIGLVVQKRHQLNTPSGIQLA